MALTDAVVVVGEMVQEVLFVARTTWPANPFR